jgi:hypothetical protein
MAIGRKNFMAAQKERLLVYFRTGQRNSQLRACVKKSFREEEMVWVELRFSGAEKLFTLLAASDAEVKSSSSGAEAHT